MLTGGKLAVVWAMFFMLLAVVAIKYINPAYSQPSTTNPVHAGEGNASTVVVAFVPDTIKIKAGDSVIWNNPTTVAEPHSATFIKDNKYFAEFAAPFQVSNSTEFRPTIPDSNAEVIIPPGKPGESEKTVVAINGRAYLPVAIDSTGKNVTYLPPNSNYTMDGTESYFNSGWLWPKGQTPGGAPELANFTVTFEKAGTYSYLCNVHPWMTGTVMVE
jgi:plastocyanin